ncbi:MAG TPA: CPBP family intramembrane glutamic endopeptidase [Vitreimonas sp.]|uniref:CPBP family intramembrane glutamic endopeptidase n=1 Tax=Vitreimonas sp. TaxID=3069702 RepID=UPI002D50817B|nr:CPBP family intramembrane glutamic endopeptidase [Vitreimonas sp.]HYD88151.1 CPBP family intramembrane glutamic endopeptidase [Vitreimonas sp.]
MSTTKKSAIFLAVAFAISWAITIGGHYAGLKESLGLAGPILLLSAMMTGPAISALICAFAFEKGRRVDALGLRFRPNIWWLLAWAIPIALAAGSVVLTLVLSDRTFVDIGEASRQAAEAQGQDFSQMPPWLTSSAFIVILAITLGALINAPILTFTEELGWRGYLHDLWRPFGFWRASLGTGFVWGLWHAPAIFFYGLNYPDNAALGIGLFTLFCMLLSPILTLVRDRAGSVWAAGIFHGAFNAVGGLTLGMVSEPIFPWNGIVGIGGFLALAIGVGAVFLMQRNARAPAAQAAT